MAVGAGRPPFGRCFSSRRHALTYGYLWILEAMRRLVAGLQRSNRGPLQSFGRDRRTAVLRHAKLRGGPIFDFGRWHDRCERRARRNQSVSDPPGLIVGRRHLIGGTAQFPAHDNTSLALKHQYPRSVRGQPVPVVGCSRTRHPHALGFGTAGAWFPLSAAAWNEDDAATLVRCGPPGLRRVGPGRRVQLDPRLRRRRYHAISTILSLVTTHLPSFSSTVYVLPEALL